MSRSWERLADVVEAMPDRVATAVRDGLSGRGPRRRRAGHRRPARGGAGERRRAPHPHIELTGYGAEPARLVPAGSWKPSGASTPT
ncbi:MAG: hypothetical protein U0133_01425 [Gemmatimonadales bacterium]